MSEAAPMRNISLMNFAVILRIRPDASEELQARHRLAEAEAIWAATKEGSLRSIHFHDGPGALLLMEATDKTAAAAWVSLLPMVSAGVVDSEVLALKPFDGLEVLFSDKATQRTSSGKN